MDVTIIILAGLSVAALGILILRMGKRLALFLLVMGGLAVAMTVAWALTEQARATRQAAEAATVAAAGQATMSAATSITLFLMMVILGMALLVGGTVGLSCWLRQRQKRARLEDALQQAQIYALLQGARSPRTFGSRAGTPGLAQAGGNILVFPGSGQQPTPQLMVDDLRAMGQPDPLAGLLPPDDGGWEVL